MESPKLILETLIQIMVQTGKMELKGEEKKIHVMNQLEEAFTLSFLQVEMLYVTIDVLVSASKRKFKFGKDKSFFPCCLL